MVMPGTVVISPICFGTTQGYAFTYWTINGVRQPASNGGGSPRDTGTINAYTQILSADPASEDFGTVHVGSAVERTITISNIGTEALSGQATASAPFTVIGGSSYTLAPGANTPVVVRFVPAASGTSVGAISFTGGAGLVVSTTGAGIISTDYTAWCSAHGLSGPAADPTGNRDWTGFDNYVKWALGFDPNDPSSHFKVTVLGTRYGNVRFLFNSVKPGVSYLLTHFNASTGLWEPLQTFQFPSAQTNVEIQYPACGPMYRVNVALPSDFRPSGW